MVISVSRCTRLIALILSFSLVSFPSLGLGSPNAAMFVLSGEPKFVNHARSSSNFLSPSIKWRIDEGPALCFVQCLVWAHLDWCYGPPTDDVICRSFDFICVLSSREPKRKMASFETTQLLITHSLRAEDVYDILISEGRDRNKLSIQRRRQNQSLWVDDANSTTTRPSFTMGPWPMGHTRWGLDGCG